MKKLLKACDIFSVSQFTLYRTKEYYSTVTGGVVSILILGSLVALFISMAIDTFKYNTIIVNSQMAFDSDPINYKIIPNAANRFMFAVGLITDDIFDLSQLDITLHNFTVINTDMDSTITNSTVPLQKCTLSQWDGINKDVSFDFKLFAIDYFLCPPDNYPI